jgi:hypothetical protein
MKIETFIEAVNGVQPADGYKQRLESAAASAHNRRPAFLKLAVPVAACLILAAVSVFALRGGSQSETDYTKITGLPVDNFTLAGVGELPQASRIAYHRLSDLFRYDGPVIFAFARVLDTEQKLEGIPFDVRGIWKQTSSLRILSVLRSGGANIHEPVTIKQTMHMPAMIGGANNLLREGGVYLLPLTLYEGKWHLLGDLDVLFEVDDQGLVWSHSEFEGFNRFDGQHASVLAEAVLSVVP